jgi:hypothetical protein
LGPIAGGLIAVGCAYILRGGGGDPVSYAAGSGLLDAGSLRAKHRHLRRVERDEAFPPTAGSADPPPADTSEAPRTDR